MPSIISQAARVVQREWKLRRAVDADSFYQNMGFDVLEGYESGYDDPTVPLWLNFGYWKGVDTQDKACKQLADLLAEAAHMSRGDRVLDCGFGFAEQDFHWLQTRQPAHITGINITPMHIEHAQRRSEARGMSDRLTLKLASATELPFADASFDCVVALESAFHFQTREQFFAEAFRVLKPGGWLAAADVLPLPGDPIPPWSGMILKRFSWPRYNCYDRNIYADKLAARGFVNIGKESIRDYVFPGFRAYGRARKAGAKRDVAVEIPREDFETCRGSLGMRLAGVGDYVIMSGQKPASR